MTAVSSCSGRTNCGVRGIDKLAMKDFLYIYVYIYIYYLHIIISIERETGFILTFHFLLKTSKSPFT